MRLTKCFLLLLLLSLSSVACSTSIHPQVEVTNTVEHKFGHELFDQVLRKYVNDEGKVNYSQLLKDRKELEEYYALIATYSPDSHPQLFTTENSKLSYWINAYNASAIRGVLQYYPIKSVKDVPLPTLLFFAPKLSAFFIFNRHTFGSVETNLYYVENKVVRKRFKDPRFHFALNCASAGCPTLPNEAFIPETLDAQLERETRKFFSQSRNLTIDENSKTIYLSSILKWYEDDFTTSLTAEDSEATILTFVRKYAPTEALESLSDSTYSIRYFDYDWTLNDQY